jgi:hypothetical protein
MEGSRAEAAAPTFATIVMQLLRGSLDPKDQNKREACHWCFSARLRRKSPTKVTNRLRTRHCSTPVAALLYLFAGRPWSKKEHRGPPCLNKTNLRNSLVKPVLLHRRRQKRAAARRSTARCRRRSKDSPSAHRRSLRSLLWRKPSSRPFPSFHPSGSCPLPTDSPTPFQSQRVPVHARRLTGYHLPIRTLVATLDTTVTSRPGPIALGITRR